MKWSFWGILCLILTHTCNTHDQCTTFRDTTTGPTAFNSSQCNQQRCKHANNIRKITTKAGTELRFIINTIIIIIGTNNKKICMKLKLEIILYLPGLVRKERTKALCLYLKRNKAYFGFILTPYWHWNFKGGVLSYHWLGVVTKIWEIFVDFHMGKNTSLLSCCGKLRYSSG